MAGFSGNRSNCSSRSSFIYPNINSGVQSPNMLSFEADPEPRSPDIGGPSRYSFDSETGVEDVSSSSSDENPTNDSSGDERYLETRLSDMEFQSTFRSAGGNGVSTRSNEYRQLVPLMTDAQIRHAILGNEAAGRRNSEEHSSSPRASTHTIEASGGNELIRDSELTEDELRLRRELEKVRKLDKILRKKQRLADRVKRDRISLQRHVVSEVEMLETGSITSDRTPSREEAVNTHKYLALVKNDIQLKPSKLKMVKQEQEGASGGFEPVFATQPMLEEDQLSSSTGSQIKSGFKSQASKSSKGSKSRQSPTMRTESHRSTSSAGDNSSTTSTKNSNTSSKGSSKKQGNKKFIERNKELASDAANIIPMTSEERNRLDGLLKDIDIIEEEPTDYITTSTSPIIGSVGENTAPRYYAMSATESKKLNEIDDKLSGYLTFEQFKEICWNSAPVATSESATGSGSVLEDESEASVGSKPLSGGDVKIKETRDERIAQIRIAHIDEKLRRLQLENCEENDVSSVDGSRIDNGVSEMQLKRLLNELTQQHSSEAEQGLIYPKPNEDQIKSLLSVSRPSTSFEEWRYIGSSQTKSFSKEVEEMSRYLDDVDNFVQAIEYNTDDFSQSMNIESIESSENHGVLVPLQTTSAVNSSQTGIDHNGSGFTTELSNRVMHNQSAEKLSQDIQMLDLRTDLIMRRLANLPELKDPATVGSVPGNDEIIARSVTFEDIEQNERLYELDRDMENLRNKLEGLQKLREQTLSHLAISQDTSTET